MPLLPFGSVFLLAGLTARAAAGATIPEATTTTTTTTSEGEFGPSTPKAFRMLMSVQGEGNVAPMPLGAMATQQQGMWESWSQGSQQDIKPDYGCKMCTQQLKNAYQCGLERSHGDTTLIGSAIYSVCGFGSTALYGLVDQTGRLYWIGGGEMQMGIVMTSICPAAQAYFTKVGRGTKVKATVFDGTLASPAP